MNVSHVLLALSQTPTTLAVPFVTLVIIKMAFPVSLVLQATSHKPVKQAVFSVNPVLFPTATAMDAITVLKELTKEL